MIEKLKERREGLKEDLARGQQRLAELEGEVQKLKEVMARIVGAIQMLDETIAEEEAAGRA